MTVPYPRPQTVFVTADTTIPTTTETVVATLGGYSTDGAGQTLALFGFCLLTTGTGTTTVTVRVRRTSLTGTLIGEAFVTTGIGAAGSTGPYTITATDAPGDVASLPYVLTVQQAAAGANGSALAAYLQCFAT